jgi:dephospho-CoA kinase
MIAAQATRAQRLAIADDVVSNTSTLARLEGVARNLDVLYRSLAVVGV